jgi:hypothetical protein
MMDKNKPGRFLDRDELEGFLDAHLAFVKNHVGEYRDLTPEYVAETRAALERVGQGATYADLMEGASG